MPYNTICHIWVAFHPTKTGMRATDSPDCVDTEYVLRLGPLTMAFRYDGIGILDKNLNIANHNSPELGRYALYDHVGGSILRDIQMRIK